MATGALYSFAEMFERLLKAFQEIAKHEETFVQLFNIMTSFFGTLFDIISALANITIPGFNKSLLEMIAIFKVLSGLGIIGALGGIGGPLLKAARGLAGLTTAAAGQRVAGTVAGGLQRVGLGGVASRTLGHQGGRAMLGRGIIAGATRLGAAAALGTGVGTVVLGGAYALDKLGIVDVPFLANGGYVRNMANGGPVVVGEQGPELFIPGQSGQVLNNAETNNMMERDVVFRNARISIDSFGGLA